MNTLLKKPFTLAASVIIAGLMIGNASAQVIGNASAQSSVKGDKPMFEDLQSPQFSGGKQKNGFKPKDWLEIEAKLKVSTKPEPKTKSCDKLTVKWYVAVKNLEKPGTMMLFTKDVEYVNIPLDEELYFSVYLSPSSIFRLTGRSLAGKSSVEGVGYEVLIDGEKVAEETTKWKVGWWAAASDKISKSDVVPLLIKPQTPFASMWWDRYAEVNEVNSAR